MIRFCAYLKRVPNQQQQPLASSLLAPVELTRITSVLVASLLVQLPKCPQAQVGGGIGVSPGCVRAVARSSAQPQQPLTPSFLPSQRATHR
jgi:hypothetical protein